MNGDKNTKKGFTLIELLVSAFIFILIIGGIVNILVTSIRLQQRILADQKMLAEVSFVLEYMGRTLRMARKDVNGNCVEPENSNYISFHGGREIRFLNFDGNCQEFSLDNASITERIANGEEEDHLSDSMPITSGNVVITSLVFDDAGSNWHLGSNQSKVAIRLGVKPRTGGSEMFFQTVVSQRRLNIP